MNREGISPSRAVHQTALILTVFGACPLLGFDSAPPLPPRLRVNPLSNPTRRTEARLYPMDAPTCPRHPGLQLVDPSVQGQLQVEVMGVGTIGVLYVVGSPSARGRLQDSERMLCSGLNVVEGVEGPSGFLKLPKEQDMNQMLPAIDFGWRWCFEPGTEGGDSCGRPGVHLPIGAPVGWLRGSGEPAIPLHPVQGTIDLGKVGGPGVGIEGIELLFQLVSGGRPTEQAEEKVCQGHPLSYMSLHLDTRCARI